MYTYAPVFCHLEILSRHCRYLFCLILTSLSCIPCISSCPRAQRTLLLTFRSHVDARPVSCLLEPSYCRNTAPHMYVFYSRQVCRDGFLWIDNATCSVDVGSVILRFVAPTTHFACCFRILLMDRNDFCERPISYQIAPLPRFPNSMLGLKRAIIRSPSDHDAVLARARRRIVFTRFVSALLPEPAIAVFSLTRLVSVISL